MRLIFHVDMDAFFASVEQRDHPELRGRPVIVGGGKKRGVVAAASYEVRKFGVHSAMPMVRALRKCPDAVVIKPRMSHYAAASKQLMAVLDNYSPLVEPLSLDEAFLDMTGTEKLFGTPLETAAALKRDIFEATDGLTCSVGIAPNKFLAKIASDLDKPDGVTFIRHGTERQTLAPMSIRKIWGVGKKTAKKLESRMLHTIGDIAEADFIKLAGIVGERSARHLKQLARGEDDRPVVADRERKSVGAETTLSEDIRGRQQIEKHLRAQCERVARELRKKNLRAESARVKLRYSRTFRLKTRQGPMPTAADDSRTLFETTRRLLDTLELDEPIRLVGAAAFDLIAEDDTVQLALFDGERKQNAKLEKTLDAIRDKFGDKIGRGSQ
ncbi:DNA polymerase IV [Persicimonas caeni]|uniref:DNA polymerase IV n=1 Tax=Persicimonas caeni TaxID=2292766 RepID=A0A4Y6PVJ2_PERCE|nr:DNA polymerase IV [Persicimonas caeni]QDG52356.1 DNA polymerase IV [Persicimonas caeni]QED33578.1 DNA polymerase IV [Persicimonas caeni]